MSASRALFVVAITSAVVSGTIVLLFVVRPALGSPQPGVFTIREAIVVAGYFLFPVLMLVAGALMLIAVILLLGAAVERRRSDRGVR